MVQHETGKWDCELLGHFELEHLADLQNGDELYFCLMCDAQIVVKAEENERLNENLNREFKDGEVPF